MKLAPPTTHPPTAAEPAPRYTVRTYDIPRPLERTGIVAMVLDAEPGYSCAWCWNVEDATRIAAALNRDEVYRARVRDESGKVTP